MAVLAKVAAALQVPVEELISPPKALARFYQADSIPRQRRGAFSFANSAGPSPGSELDRMELPPGSSMVGVPHRMGTREYLACETGQVVELVVSGRNTGYRRATSSFAEIRNTRMQTGSKSRRRL